MLTTQFENGYYKRQVLDAIDSVAVYVLFIILGVLGKTGWAW